MITHKREKPKPNGFAYRIFMFLIDVDEIEQLSKKFMPIGYNRFNLFGFYDRDHFKQKNKNNHQTTREKLVDYLKLQKIDFVPHRIELLTNLRILGYVFNPVSFYYLYDENNEVKYALAEVSNTFGEMKFYLLKNFKNGFFHEFHDKYFYISPFTRPDDRLELKAGLPGENFSIMVDDIKGDEKPVRAAISAEQKKLSTATLLWYFLRFPFITFQIIGLIHWQALKLWLKGVKFYRKDQNKEMQREMYFANSD
jgi:DUF1365 family protein